VNEARQPTISVPCPLTKARPWRAAQAIAAAQSRTEQVVECGADPMVLVLRIRQMIHLHLAGAWQLASASLKSGESSDWIRALGALRKINYLPRSLSRVVPRTIPVVGQKTWARSITLPRGPIRGRRIPSRDWFALALNPLCPSAWSCC